MDAEVILLGLLQGVTEFLPVSSSGHLALAKILMGSGDLSLAFDLILHVSTLMAVLIYFFRDISSLLVEWLYGFVNANARRWDGWRFGWAVIVGSCMTVPIAIFLKPLISDASSNMLILGGDFWITALLLLSAKFLKVSNHPVRIKNGAFVGFVQGFAVLPGISRSCTTIWAGLFSGLSRDEAFRFSFLLSIPAILGAALFEARELGGYLEFVNALPSDWFLASIVAFVSGFFSLVLLRRLVTSDKWWLFFLYCAVLGCVSAVYSIIGV
ncbi:MAG: undecaprenyl-diphosphate phosphatase [Synergistaceae bacterium]|jgi:undecaprenyl-diphosphatase|nr:undecaprenyl-diphosphate phosphatase [Synergistaceae bacterium]